MTIGGVIPDFNEESSVGLVVADLLALEGEDGLFLDDLVVCNNGSTDDTKHVAESAGARVVTEMERGYGAACLKGIAALRPVDVVLFIDADRSDVAAEAIDLVAAVAAGADLVIGSRVLGRAERGALTPQQRFGNWLAALLIRLLWGHRTTDLGPFRAIRREALEQIGMTDRNYGWTVEMQVKAIQAGLRVHEIPADYWKRIGVSKVSGTVRGTFGAGTKILGTIGKLWLLEKIGRGSRADNIEREER